MKRAQGQILRTCINLSVMANKFLIGPPRQSSPGAFFYLEVLRVPHLSYLTYEQDLMLQESRMSRLDAKLEILKKIATKNQS